MDMSEADRLEREELKKREIERRIKSRNSRIFPRRIQNCFWPVTQTCSESITTKAR